MKLLTLIAALATGLLSAAPAVACTPLIATDPETGETYTSGSNEWRRREQARWRAEADAVFIAQVREGRMVGGGEIEFTITPITTVYGGAVPEAMLLYRWNPGHTCNAFKLTLTDLVIVYADVDQIGWGVVGLTVPDQLQDPPSDFRRALREIARGIIPGPALPE